MSARHLGRRGVAAIEFGLVAPVMAVLLFALVDLSEALIAYRRTTIAAWETGEIISEMSVQTNQSMSVTPAQVQQGATLIFAMFPQLVGATPPTPETAKFAVTVSEVQFIGSPANCVAMENCNTLTPNVAWSVPLSYGQQLTRACGTLTQTLPTAAQSLLTIPTSGMTALKAALVVDVLYTFTPTFGAFIIGPIQMKRTIYVNNRALGSPYIYYDLAGYTADPAVCPGFM